LKPSLPLEEGFKNYRTKQENNMDQATKDAIAALNEAIRILLQAADTPSGPEQDQLMSSAKGEIEEAMEIITTRERLQARERKG
jgi:hypothetical protein